MLVRYGQYAMFSIMTSEPRLETETRGLEQNEFRILLILPSYDNMALSSVGLEGTRRGRDKVCRPNTHSGR